MTALPQLRVTDKQQFALRAWIRTTGTAALYLLTAAGSILLALVFGTDVWRIALLVLVLVATLALVTISVTDFFRDKP